LKDLKLHLRFSSRLFWIAVFAVLAVGIAAAPLRMAGQEAPAANSAASMQTAGTPEASKNEPLRNKEEQQTEALRLEGPVVKWTARTTHMSAATTANIFEFINFLILALGIGVPLVRWLPKFLRNRKEKLRNDIESARKVTEDATARLSAVEAKLASLDAEIAKFRAEVEAESLADEKRIKASLGEASAHIVESAEQEIGQAAAQARRGLRNFAADLAVEQAARQMVLTPETDRALIAEFISDMVRTSGAKGGMN
jgi:F-type H+-transporting ATPase subunit b